MSNATLNNKAKEMTPGELAATLGVSTMTVARWRARGCPYHELSPNTIGKTASRPRYNLAEVKAWIKEQQQKGEQA